MRAKEPTRPMRPCLLCPVNLATTTVQTDEDIGETIRQYKEEIALHKAIVEKAKECYEDAQMEAVKSKERAMQKEAELTKELQEKMTNVTETK